MVQDKISRYKLLGSLGRGGIGNVYKATSDDGEIVALKILNQHLPVNSNIIVKFFHEAKILSKLNHPNICKLVEFFTEGENHIIVMEYLEGISLNELMLSNPDNLIPLKQSIDIAKQCLTAFQYIYEMGVLHRDIKPSNIMVDNKERVIIMDFGISIFINNRIEHGTVKALSTAYSPPERFFIPEKADIRSEIYSMGMVFYELFTGRKPFNATDLADIEMWHREEIPEPVNRLNPTLSQKITNAISTALEKKQENRFKDFLEFKNAMEI